MLINLQPYAKPMSLEVNLGGPRRPAGTAREILAKRKEMRMSLRTLAELAAAGMYALLHEAPWQFENRFQSPEDWAEFVDRPTCGGVEGDPELLDAALARPDGGIVLIEEDLASVYIRRKFRSRNRPRSRSSSRTP